MVTEFTFNSVAINTTGNWSNGGLVITNIPSTTGISAGFYVYGTAWPNNAQVKSVDSSTQITVYTGFAATAAGTGGTVTFSQSDYSLPSDFDRFVDNTMWDRTRFWKMRGAMSPQEWQLYKSSPLGRATVERRWRIRLPSQSLAGSSTKFSVDPVVTDNNASWVFEYVSKNWCQSSGGTPQSNWTADTDTGILDEYLIELGVKWRILERLGIAYAEAREEYERQVDLAVARDGGTTTLDLSPGPRNFLISPYNIPETGYGS